jgi:hypothetical protein
LLALRCAGAARDGGAALTGDQEKSTLPASMFDFRLIPPS